MFSRLPAILTHILCYLLCRLFSSGDNSRPVVFLRLWRRSLCRRAHHPRRCQESWLQSGSGGDEDGEDGAAALDDDDDEHEDIKITTPTKWQVEVTDDLSTWHQADGQPKGTFFIFAWSLRKHIKELPDHYILSKISGNVPRPPNGGTVMGTIDDLSDDEKTRAFLQLLEYKLRMEKEQVPHQDQHRN